MIWQFKLDKLRCPPKMIWITIRSIVQAESSGQVSLPRSWRFNWSNSGTYIDDGGFLRSADINWCTASHLHLPCRSPAIPVAPKYPCTHIWQINSLSIDVSKSLIGIVTDRYIGRTLRLSRSIELSTTVSSLLRAVTAVSS